MFADWSHGNPSVKRCAHLCVASSNRGLPRWRNFGGQLPELNPTLRKQGSSFPAKEMSIFHTERLLTTPVSTSLRFLSRNNQREALGYHRRPHETQEQASGFCTSVPMFTALFTLKPGCLNACARLLPPGKSTVFWQAEWWPL